jgi:hypothetical protein
MTERGRSWASASTISGNPPRQVIARPAIETDAIAVLAGDHPEAVVFDLMKPERAGRRLGGLGGQARSDETGRVPARLVGTPQHSSALARLSSKAESFSLMFLRTNTRAHARPLPTGWWARQGNPGRSRDAPSEVALDGGENEPHADIKGTPGPKAVFRAGDGRGVNITSPLPPSVPPEIRSGQVIGPICEFSQVSCHGIMGSTRRRLGRCSHVFGLLARFT